MLHIRHNNNVPAAMRSALKCTNTIVQFIWFKLLLIQLDNCSSECAELILRWSPLAVWKVIIEIGWVRYKILGLRRCGLMRMLEVMRDDVGSWLLVWLLQRFVETGSLDHCCFPLPAFRVWALGRSDWRYHYSLPNRVITILAWLGWQCRDRKQ